MAELKTFFIPEQYDKDELCYAAHAREIIAALEAERDNAIHALMLDQQEARREGARDLAEGLREALFPSGRVYTAEKAGWVSLMVTKFDAALGKLKVDPPQEWRDKNVMQDDDAALGEVDRG